MNKDKVKTGEKWFARLPGSVKVKRVTVTEIRDQVVLLDSSSKELEKFGLVGVTEKDWYIFADVDFIQLDTEV